MYISYGFQGGYLECLYLYVHGMLIPKYML